MRKIRRTHFGLNEALKHPDHRRPTTRREFIAQGFLAGGATIAGGSIFSLFANPRKAYAALSPDIESLKTTCGLATQGAGKIPFICFDLAGGGNIAGSNVLVGQRGGQQDFLTTAGYSKLGLPGNMTPRAPNPTTGTFVNNELGLAFHSDSAFLRGIRSKTSPSTRSNTNGVVIPAVSENDTANNPHNPMYAILRAGADGSLLSLIGSRNSDSGGNSMGPMDMYDAKNRPTKIDRPSDVIGLVDVGDLIGLLNQDDAVAVMEAIQRVSDTKLARITTHPDASRHLVIKELVRCGYVKSADLADRFGNHDTLNAASADIVSIFEREGDSFNDEEFQKTASVMKMVVNGFAGAGTITMGGFDYHTGDRSTGEMRDERAGKCIGACLEYAAQIGVPIMIYVFSDGSVASNGMIDGTPDSPGRGKCVWTGDNSSTAASFFLVYNPAGPAQEFELNRGFGQKLQLGYMRADGSVETAATPASNNVNLLVQTVALNYMALHGEQTNFASVFPNHGLGSDSLRNSLTAFHQIVSGTI